MKTAVTYSIVVPVYQSVDALPELTERITTVFRDVVKETYEILFIDDGSPPDTWRTLVELAETFNAVRAVRLRRNFGRSAAVLCGFREMRGEWVIVMDDDLQHRPEDIPGLVHKRERDVVFAQFSDKRHGWVARAGSRITTWVEHVFLGLPGEIRNSPFFLTNKHVARLVLQIKTPHPFMPALLLSVTADLATVDVDHQPRKYDATTFTFRRRLRYFSNLLINNSALLLRTVAVLGMMVGTAGIIYGLYIFGRSWLYGSAVPGWASVMVAILILGSLILITLGIVGEYLLRIIQGIEYRPLFAIKEIVPGDGDSVPPVTQTGPVAEVTNSDGSVNDRLEAI